MGDPAAEEPAERIRHLRAPELLIAGERIRAVAPQAEVDVAARAGLAGVRLRHERQAHPRGLRDLLQALLENDVAVPHVERFGVAHVQLVLAAAPFALGGLDRHAGVLQVPSREGMEAFGAGALQAVVVAAIPAARLDVTVASLRPIAMAR